MRITTVRRICQGFFLTLFFLFCLVMTLGDDLLRLRGWPVNLILSLDPLTALATVFSTGKFYAPLLWAIPALVLTVFLGRFFCGFICPMGTLNQIVGWLAGLGRNREERVESNRIRKAQSLKFMLMIFFLASALFGSVQTGLLDPLPLLHRSVNLALTPLIDQGGGIIYDEPRSYSSVWLIGAMLVLILGANLYIPRFFCRFACPLGAMFGIMNRFSPLRIGKATNNCGSCRICEEYCEGACRPSGVIVNSECVMCMNCLVRCPADRIGFAPKASAAGETPLPDLSRRGVVLAAVSGSLAPALWGVGALAQAGRNPSLIRPPGSLDEERFLARCIRCGQCMRVCPSNVIQPTLLEAGIQGIWTPALNYRVGRSGCRVNCIACGHVCPTAAIRPLSVEERNGLGDFASKGPIRIGTAFVDRSRCLPWVMDRPCIVCQEVCPVSPKAIFTRTVFEPVRDGSFEIAGHDDTGVIPKTPPILGVNPAGGDYYLRMTGAGEKNLARISAFSGSKVGIIADFKFREVFRPGSKAEVVVKLQRPFIDASRCIGCGMCERECPISGLRGIRVYAENETRSKTGRMLI